ncbi:hypothetical protein QYH69_29310 [Paraburkholderia sp. SARCC-3016]|uniref:hypothetical protein n=1 Tax=Paraburkholderia sp. SARCC-3016 TaxID=3058611 RepID=UPI00280911AA|nr:hypothetical protein [Paraburkholderia sp. SARCC-3016]MDQ7981334.1 hypothetical protein [Paraburkholderia sp. SARCC-3016]
MNETYYLDLLVKLLNVDAEIADCERELTEVMRWLTKLPEDRGPYGADCSSALGIKLDRFRVARRDTTAMLAKACTDCFCTCERIPRRHAARRSAARP